MAPVSFEIGFIRLSPVDGSVLVLPKQQPLSHHDCEHGGFRV